MFEVTIEARWTLRLDGGPALPERTIALLLAVAEHGSLLRACAEVGVSYRHAWALIREGEALLGMSLLEMERGKGSRLSPLSEKLVWAQRRIAARLSPTLDSLGSELEAEIGRVQHENDAVLRIRASHGFAVESLHQRLNRDGVLNELRYCSSTDAVASLALDNCDLAGFHVPIGEFEPAVIEHYRRWLQPATQRVIGLATRRVGLIIARGNPKKIYGIEDLARGDLRFINRQPGSGTRFLLDLLLRRGGIEPARVHGYEQCELTHAAVAAYVASNMADVAFGVETPARRFDLDFVPLHSERYFLLCQARRLGDAVLQQTLRTLCSPEFRASVDQLAGYQADNAGRVFELGEAFPGVWAQGARARRAKPRPRGDAA
ncbi:MAG: helix-turn-helix transcriptional regulator [Betaproteobacteria bacterium]|nr:LysR family transcriptional regulator [Betaproteobacteria bacterium]MBU6511887.1 LysR family transcriptional regulator [Betaproteobacteria bacterium]MDE1954778.1 helix-turn-helix transcriptional regulator [Betaproteobacteria bacterium]MDE2152321.1 helix-turn-helix transcriptional regulator [Betaproteobacteria bacterium]MDE2478671.1 helix-turn-helix transcriptional regulator [Betaproteobacteria bacterium]